MASNFGLLACRTFGAPAWVSEDGPASRLDIVDWAVFADHFGLAGLRSFCERFICSNIHKVGIQ